MAHLHMLAVASLLVVAGLAAVASAQVQCGTLGELPISGCLTCEEVTFNTTFGDSGRGFFNGYSVGGMGTWAGRGGLGGYRGGRKLLYGRLGGFNRYGNFNGRFTLAPMPKCTECDASANYVLATDHGGHQPGMWGTGRCKCADGFGATSTGPSNVTVGNAAFTFDQFTCDACPSGQVPLGHKSGLVPAYNSTTQTWTLVLNTTVTGTRATRLVARMQANSIRTGNALQTSFIGATFMAAGLAISCPHGAEPAVRPPWSPGECVTCPDSSAPTSDGVTCVAA